MRISYVQGDLLQGVPVIIHGCNAQGRMGRGVALAIREQLPFAYEAYMSHHKHHGLKLGEIVWAIQTGVKDKPTKIVGNAITQEYWQANMAPANGCLVDYDAIRSCVREIEQFARLTQDGDRHRGPSLDIASIGYIKEVGFPMIGAGLGGGDWDIISAIIEDESKDTFRPIVYRL